MKKEMLHPPIGAHMSIAGGYYKAVERAVEAGCKCVQLFTKNNNQWRAKDITDDDALQFQQAVKESGFKHSLAHVSYLVNMASPNLELWKKSIAAMVVELQRADRLGIPYVVVHPGAYTTSEEESGLARIAEALDAIYGEVGECATQCLLETTAGQGSVLGARFEHLATIIDKVDQAERLGVCFDTCHSFSAG